MYSPFSMFSALHEQQQRECVTMTSFSYIKHCPLPVHYIHRPTVRMKCSLWKDLAEVHALLMPNSWVPLKNRDLSRYTPALTHIRQNPRKDYVNYTNRHFVLLHSTPSMWLCLVEGIECCCTDSLFWLG